jgi:hypothetical protein
MNVSKMCYRVFWYDKKNILFVIYLLKIQESNFPNKSNQFFFYKEVKSRFIPGMQFVIVFFLPRGLSKTETIKSQSCCLRQESGILTL